MVTSRPATQTAQTESTTYSLQIVPPGPQAELALRLRYRVFADEMGAHLPNNAGRDLDEWDAHCDHLMVRDDTTGEVVGSYRILPPRVAMQLGRSYSAGEFDLSELASIAGSLVEVGRSCVDPAHRNGAVIGLLWSGLARYMLLSGHRYLGGCASIPLRDGLDNAASVVRQSMSNSPPPRGFSVLPLQPWNYAERADVARPTVPPLLRAYLRLGAWVCGGPAIDFDFGTADLYILLDMERIDRRIARRFLQAA
ncbi:putative hemolysin [Antricoccus suffuscus]|uniref:Putative hemolysin n=1 Tax=Antricoccus suffuscus TaxID=1629062 RepID=A0A2T0Z8T5_9ACTN|nr:GNAT family N-acyltransferase [Antricoccus suffuscus]PRZ32769.1 putative hemolysin [Antricoccus suffuscus]